MPDPEKVRSSFKQLYRKCGKFKNDTPKTKNKSSDQIVLNNDD